MKNIALTLCLSSALAASALELPQQLGDHAVLQQQQTEANLWGWAAPGAEVTAVTSWNGRKYSAKAGNDGRWIMAVETPAASYTPYSITFTEGKEKKTVNDILIGEVWVAAGQSNIEMPLRGFNSQPVEGAAEAVAHSGKLRDKVRMAYLMRNDELEPQQRGNGAWKVSSPENSPEFSAQGFFFARELNNLLDVPVGILCLPYGGTQVEGWMPRDLLESLGFDWTAVNSNENTSPAYLYSTKYNGLVYPVKDYTIKGFIWNQGESNIDHPDNYADLLTAMVERWRQDWGDKENSLPFYQTENPCFGWFQPDAVFGSLIREQQQKAAKMIPNSGITYTNDLIHPFECDVIHGSRKREIGERMAWQVAERQYGIKGMPWKCPEFAGLKKAGMEPHTIRVTFTNPGYGLIPNVGNVEGFEAAGADGKFYPAKAKVDWNIPDVILTCDSVADIKDVRYCFKNFCIGGLKNSWGMPAAQFRTDK